MVNTKNDLRCWEYRTDEYENGQPKDGIIHVDAVQNFLCSESDSTLHC